MKVPAKGRTGSVPSTSLNHHASMLVASRGNLSCTDPIDVFATIVFQRSLERLPLSEVRNRRENRQVESMNERFSRSNNHRNMVVKTRRRHRAQPISQKAILNTFDFLKIRRPIFFGSQSPLYHFQTSFKHIPSGWVGYFFNECGFSVESIILQRISSNSFL